MRTLALLTRIGQPPHTSLPRLSALSRIQAPFLSVRVTAAMSSSAAASVPSTMKALQIKEQGGLDVLRTSDSVPVPQPGPEDVQFKVEYAGVNFIDTYHRSGLYKVALPYVLGQESAGKVTAIGEKARGNGIQMGDLVAAYGPGAFAEYVSVPQTKVAKLPAHLGANRAAASLLQGLTAWTLVREAYPVKKGDWVLVHAAAGGTGTLLCQMASHLGARVIGTASTAEKVDIAKRNGAEHVINYSHEDIEERVMALTNGQGVAGIFDGVGKDTFETDFKVIARKGTLVTFGNASGPVDPFSPMKLTPKNVKVCRPTLNNYVATQEEFDTYTRELFDLIEKGIVRIAVHKEYPFSVEGIRQAQEDLTSRKTTGKLIVKVA